MVDIPLAQPTPKQHTPFFYAVRQCFTVLPAESRTRTADPFDMTVTSAHFCCFVGRVKWSVIVGLIYKIVAEKGFVGSESRSSEKQDEKKGG